MFNSHISLQLSCTSGIETINTSIYSVVPSKTIPDSRPKWAMCLPLFRPKRRKNPTRWGGTYLYSLYKGLPLPPGCLSSLFRPLTRHTINDVGASIFNLTTTQTTFSLNFFSDFYPSLRCSVFTLMKVRTHKVLTHAVFKVSTFHRSNSYKSLSY